MRKIGRYQLVRRLASGALGEVFLGQAEGDFAIRLIKQQLADDPRFARLVLIEGQTAARFSHPVAVRVYEAERNGGDLYLSTELVEGQPLSSVLKKLRVDEAPLDHRLICHLGAEVASVLARSHELPWFTGGPAKFLHGALAPKKIMIRYDGATKLLGLGWGRARLTQPLGMGTLPYAAPEVAQGREPTIRADVFSLACILYYAFSGRAIFRRGDEESTRTAIREANAPPLNSSTLTVDPAIGDLIAEMMAPRIDARPDSMSAIEAKLRAAGGLLREEAAAELARVLEGSFAEEAQMFRRQTEAAARAAVLAPREEVKRKLPEREDSRLIEVPKVAWTTNDVEPVNPLGPREALEPATTEPDRPPPPRGRIGRYLIERPISKSSSSDLYACRDPNVARPVMIKVVDPLSVTDPRLARTEWVRLFKVEARITGSVRHAGFPTLYDAGRDDGAYFIALEALSGETLAARLDRGERFTSSQVKRIAIDLALALQHLHQLGAIHGDVKASNVMIDDAGRARLFDLSLASHVEGPQHPLLASNLMVASPEFLAGGPYLPAAEQFALGTLIYQLSVGARPYRGLDDAELRRSIRETTPRPPEAIEPSVDPLLSEVTMRLLEKDPMARFESMLAFAERLQEAPSQRPPTVLDHDTVPSRPPAAVLSSADLAETVVRICERVSTLSAPDFVHRAISDGPAMARSVARRLSLGEEAELRAALAVAIRDLADRARLSIQSDEMAPLIPRPVAELVLAVDRASQDGESDALAQVVAVVETYLRSTRPREGKLRSSPRRAVLDLRARAGTDFQVEVVEALIEHLREVVSALDLTPADPGAPRILVAGVPSDALLHALEFDGFAIEEVADGHAAWEKLRKDGFSGAIVDASLPGRDGVSLLKLCRAHPDTAAIAFLILGGEANELEGLGSAAVLERSAALENIRAQVGRLIRREPNR